MRTFLKYWLPVFIWLGVIFAGSTDIFSTEQTSRYLVPFLRWLDPQISLSTIAAIYFALRKIGHLTEYAILAAFLWRALRNVSSLRAKMSTLFVEVWVACAIIAATDEFHQSFIASRTASLNDAFTDNAGAAIGLAICLAVARRTQKS
ncbi:MAG TPA: VanZ family protein [Candidatus Binatia bacterium]|jgi:VanZ family protein